MRAPFDEDTRVLLHLKEKLFQVRRKSEAASVGYTINEHFCLFLISDGTHVSYGTMESLKDGGGGEGIGTQMPWLPTACLCLLGAVPSSWDGGVSKASHPAVRTHPARTSVVNSS